jgi:hypothetical protein
VGSNVGLDTSFLMLSSRRSSRTSPQDTRVLASIFNPESSTSYHAPYEVLGHNDLDLAAGARSVAV